MSVSLKTNIRNLIIRTEIFLTPKKMNMFNRITDI